MKKVLCLALALLLMLGTMGTALAEEGASGSSPEAEWDRLEKEGIVRTENGQSLVDIFVPAMYLAGVEITQESLDADAGQDYTYGVLGDDGSVTYSMTKEQYISMLNEVISGFNEVTEGMIADPGYAFTKVEHNKDFTQIDAYVSTQELRLNESYCAQSFYSFALTYNMYACRELERFIVNYYGPDGTLLDTVDSALMTGSQVDLASYQLKEADYPETVLVDNEYCKLTITSIEANDGALFTLNAVLENKSDKNITFSFQNGSVNGYMINPGWVASMAAGQTSEASIGFSKGDIKMTGADEVTEIKTSLIGFDSDTLADQYVDEPVVIYPMGEANVKRYPREDQPTDKVVFDNDKCRMVVYDSGMDIALGYTLSVYMENKTEDCKLAFLTNGCSVNGIEMSPTWAQSINAGCNAYSKIFWLGNPFQENGIDKVEKVDIQIRSYNMTDVTAKPDVDDTFTIEP